MGLPIGGLLISKDTLYCTACILWVELTSEFTSALGKSDGHAVWPNGMPRGAVQAHFVQ